METERGGIIVLVGIVHFTRSWKFHLIDLLSLVEDWSTVCRVYSMLLGNHYASSGKICLQGVEEIKTLMFLRKKSLYTIRSLAKDEDGDTSEWSPSSNIEVLSELELKCLFVASGVEIWSMPPAISYDGTVYVVLFAISQNGTITWVHRGWSSGVPAITSSGSIVVPMKLEVYLFNNNGRARGKTRIAKLYSSIGCAPLIGNNGTIYDIGYTKEADALFAVTNSEPLAHYPWPMYQHDPQHKGRAD